MPFTMHLLVIQHITLIHFFDIVLNSAEFLKCVIGIDPEQGIGCLNSSSLNTYSGDSLSSHSSKGRKGGR